MKLKLKRNLESPILSCAIGVETMVSPPSRRREQFVIEDRFGFELESSVLGESIGDAIDRARKICAEPGTLDGVPLRRLNLRAASVQFRSKNEECDGLLEFDGEPDRRLPVPRVLDDVELLRVAHRAAPFETSATSCARSTRSGSLWA
ncbi:MAG: hypothetical protein JST54_13145 [Deltaproteobacteria bacterium]|nr:hypothetical protein [Deltaproteobacteria bacterium]